jgi:hypothetical protein
MFLHSRGEDKTCIYQIILSHILKDEITAITSAEWKYFSSLLLSSSRMARVYLYSSYLHELDVSSDKDVPRDSKQDLLIHICKYQQKCGSLVETGLSRERPIVFFQWWNTPGAFSKINWWKTQSYHGSYKCWVFRVGSCSDCCLIGCDTIDPEDGSRMFLWNIGSLNFWLLR